MIRGLRSRHRRIWLLLALLLPLLYLAALLVRPRAPLVEVLPAPLAAADGSAPAGAVPGQAAEVLP